MFEEGCTCIGMVADKLITVMIGQMYEEKRVRVSVVDRRDARRMFLLVEI